MPDPTAPAPRERDGHCEPDCPYLVTLPGRDCNGHCKLLNLPLGWYDYHLSECQREQRAVRAELERRYCASLTTLELVHRTDRMARRQKKLAAALDSAAPGA